MQTFSGHKSGVLSAAFDASGAHIVSASDDKTVKLWSVASGACVQTFSGHQGRVLSAAFDASGAYIVSASHDGTVRTWSVAEGGCLRVFATLPEQQWASVDVRAQRFIAASPDAWRWMRYVDGAGVVHPAEAVALVAGLEWPVDFRVPD